MVINPPPGRANKCPGVTVMPLLSCTHWVVILGSKSVTSPGTKRPSAVKCDARCCRVCLPQQSTSLLTRQNPRTNDPAQTDGVGSASRKDDVVARSRGGISCLAHLGEVKADDQAICCRPFFGRQVWCNRVVKPAWENQQLASLGGVIDFGPAMPWPFLFDPKTGRGH